MTEQKEKESSPDSTAATSSSFSSSTGISGASVSSDIPSSSTGPLHLQMPNCLLSPNALSVSTSSSYCNSSPRSSATGPTEVRERSSSNSSLSCGQISYRDLPDIQDEFKIVKILHDGKFAKILLAKELGIDEDDAATDKTVKSPNLLKSSSRGNSNSNKCLVLKAIQSGGLFTDDFKRQLRYNYFLSPHPNIVTSFNVSFNWASSFNVYVQEHAPFGDLSKYITKGNNNTRKSLQESQVKLVASQIASALEFMHSFKLVHQDVRAENILIFKSNLSRVKLCDFGKTRKEGTHFLKGSLFSCSSSSFLPPELCYLLPQERCESHRSSDVWQLGILICICLTGSCPWDQADFADPSFRHYTNWLKRKSLRVPDTFRKFTPRLIRLLKRLLEPKNHFRSEIREVFKYLGDDWIKASHCVNRMNSTGSNSSGSIKAKKSSFNKRHNNVNCKVARHENAGILGVKELNSETHKDSLIPSGKIVNIKKATLGMISNAQLKQVFAEDPNDASITKRVEHWVATSAAVGTAVIASGGSTSDDAQDD